MRKERSSSQGAGHSGSRNISWGIPGAILLLLLTILVVASQQGLARAATRSGSGGQENAARTRAHIGHAHIASVKTQTKRKHTVSTKAHAKHKKIAHAKAPAKRGVRAHDGAPAKLGDIAADWALRQLGKPYRWAAAGPSSFDCSGLTMQAWEHAGVQLEHWTGSQWTSGPHIPLNQLRRGDLVFYASNTANPATIHHVGLYIGDGKMVDAPHDGVTVRIETINEPGLIGATRPA